MRLDNKVALVTGGAQGIGQGIAERFVEAGAATLPAVLSLMNAQGIPSYPVCHGHAEFLQCRPAFGRQKQRMGTLLPRQAFRSLEINGLGSLKTACRAYFGEQCHSIAQSSAASVCPDGCRRLDPAHTQAL